MFRRRLYTFLGLLLVLALLMPTAAAAQEPDDFAPEQEPDTLAVVRYTALGDSIATGVDFYFWILSYPERYRFDLGAALRSANPWTIVSFRQEARDGITSQELLDRLRSDGSLRALLHRSTAISWNIGGNDLRAARKLYKEGTCGGPLNEECLQSATALVIHNLSAIQAELLQIRAGQPTILRTIDFYNPFVAADRNANSWDDGGACAGGVDCTDLQVFQRYLDQVNAHLRDVICGGNAHPGTLSYCAPVALAFNGPDGQGDPIAARLVTIIDGIHPTNRGQRAIAGLVNCLGYQPLLPIGPTDCSVAVASTLDDVEEMEYTQLTFLPAIHNR